MLQAAPLEKREMPAAAASIKISAASPEIRFRPKLRVPGGQEAVMSRAGRWARVAVSLLALVSLSGCWIPSVNPLYEEGDAIFDPGLVGAWQADDAKATMAFSHDPDSKCYELIYREENEGRTEFRACVVQLGTLRFLDIKPTEVNQPDALSAHMLALHSFWKLQLDGDRLELQPLNAEWFKEMDDKKHLQLEHFDSGGDLVLTATTASLRSFFLQNGALEGVFGEKSEFRRRK